MAAGHPVCRLCGSSATEDRGKIPDSDYFAGQVLATPLAGGRLWRCTSCRSMFRHPILSSAQYWDLYQSGPLPWGAGEHREDLRRVRSIIAKAPIRSVLDVGCSSGDFLASLPTHMAKFGIEPSGAASTARDRGIEIVALGLEQCPEERLFDAVTLLDVIEHIPDPKEFLRRAYALVSPGGLLIISTGNPQTVVWHRAFRGRFWYVSYPEHISFPAPVFFQVWCAQEGAVLAQLHVTPHQILNPLQRAAGVALQAAFFISPSAFSRATRLLESLRTGRKCTRGAFSPDVPGAFTDHQIAVIVKPGS